MRRAWLDAYLLEHPCEHCGEGDPVVLDFHHIDPATKIDNVSNLVRRGHGLQAIADEVAKCMVLCANCHRRLHHKLFLEKTLDIAEPLA